MQTFENNALVIGSDDFENQVPVPNGNYAPIRYNALKHGILSKLVVFPHEDRSEFDSLLTGLIEEHQPTEVTEIHLVEELASILWRKRRVLMGEGAALNSSLWNVAHEQHNKSTVRASVPLEVGLSNDSHDLIDLLTSGPEEMAERQRDAELDLAAPNKAAAILLKGGANAYKRARLALIEDSRDWWDSSVEEEEYPATAEGLTDFIDERLRPICYRMEKEARYQPAIKAQTLGEGVQAHRLEKLNRYETHLDRKFERTLAMLLRLKELRNRSYSNSEK
ncbi:MAG: hypothetical protein HOP23_18595 [Methylococcaceae bacterium]|nr:hypothetical protein [Methylococcaceae bacterium]